VVAPRVEVLLHPTCPSSRSLVRGLADRGLLDSVELVVLERPAPLGGGVFPWSVPLVVVDGEPVAMDPVDAGEVEAIVEGGEVSVGDEVEAFYWATVYSAYASATILAHGGPEPLLAEPSFLKPALRLPARGVGVDEARARLEGAVGGLFEGRRLETLARALAIALARYYYWAGGRDPRVLEGLGEGGVGAWILAMASVGRAFLPWEPRAPLMAGYIAGFLARGARGLLRKVEREQAEVMGDEEYLSLIRGAKRI